MPLGSVLILRPGALGDAVLTLPVLAALKSAGTENISVLGTPASWAFMPRTPGAPRTLDFSSSDWLGLFADGAQLSLAAKRLLGNTQMAIVYLGGDTAALERRLTGFGVETVQTIAPPIAGGTFSTSEMPRQILINRESLGAQHAARRLLDPLGVWLPAAIRVDAMRQFGAGIIGWLQPTPEEHRSSQAYGETLPGGERGFFALHPGSGGRQKCWPVDRFAELAARLSRELDRIPLVFFGPADDETRAAFQAAMPAEAEWCALDQRPLRGVLALLNSSRVFVGNDSGIAHLAAGVTRVRAIFGPTDPEQWAPVGADVRVIQAPRGTLQALSVDEVFDFVIESLK